MRFFLLAVSIIAVLQFSCSSSKDDDSRDDNSREELSVSAKQMYAWLNLMPGDKPRFHLTGRLEVENKTSSDVSSLKIDEVKVFQSGREFYKFNPVVDTTHNELSRVAAGEKRSFQFSDGMGFRVDTSFNAELPIKAVVSFVHDNDTLVFSSNEIKVERVY